MYNVISNIATFPISQFSTRVSSNRERFPGTAYDIVESDSVLEQRRLASDLDDRQILRLLLRIERTNTCIYSKTCHVIHLLLLYIARVLRGLQVQESRDKRYYKLRRLVKRNEVINRAIYSEVMEMKASLALAQVTTGALSPDSLTEVRIFCHVEQTSNL